MYRVLLQNDILSKNETEIICLYDDISSLFEIINRRFSYYKIIKVEKINHKLAIIEEATEEEKRKLNEVV